MKNWIADLKLLTLLNKVFYLMAALLLIQKRMNLIFYIRYTGSFDSFCKPSQTLSSELSFIICLLYQISQNFIHRKRLKNKFIEIFL